MIKSTESARTSVAENTNLNANNMRVQYYTHRDSFELLPSISINRVRFSLLENYIIMVSWGTMTVEFSF